MLGFIIDGADLEKIESVGEAEAHLRVRYDSRVLATCDVYVPVHCQLISQLKLGRAAASRVGGLYRCIASQTKTPSWPRATSAS
jgi:hypothetical protein